MELLLNNNLIEACKKNDRKAQLAIYKNYCDAMYFVAFRFLKNSFEAEEAIQEGFITAFSKLDQYSGESTFGAWLKKIIIHKSLDMLRSKKMNMIALNEHNLEMIDEDEDWEVDETVNLEQIKQEIENLPEKYRFPIMLFLMEGYDHEEISEILNIKVVSSRTLVHRGKKLLQKQLKELRYGTGS